MYAFRTHLHADDFRLSQLGLLCLVLQSLRIKAVLEHREGQLHPDGSTCVPSS